MVEQCSLQAVAYTQTNDYFLHIRDFLRYPRLCELFDIGLIDFDINMADNALILGLKSVSHQRSIAQDGVSLTREGRLVELIEPGGYDQNFPSYEIARAFYQVLVASFTFNLETPPTYMRSLRRRGKETVYDATGRHWEKPSRDSYEESLYLGYGNVGFKNVIEIKGGLGVSSDQDVTWETGTAVPPAFKDALWWNAHQLSDYKTLDKKI